MVTVSIALHQSVGTFELDLGIDSAHNSRIGHTVNVITDIGQTGLLAGLTNGTAGNLESNFAAAFPTFFVLQRLFQRTPEKSDKAFQRSIIYAKIDSLFPTALGTVEDELFKDLIALFFAQNKNQMITELFE